MTITTVIAQNFLTFSCFNRGETNLLKFFPLFWETGTKVLAFPF